MTDNADDIMDITNQCEFKVYQWLDEFVRIAASNPFPEQDMPLPSDGLELDDEWGNFHKKVPSQYYINLLLLADYFHMDTLMEAMYASIAYATKNLNPAEIEKVCYTEKELKSIKSN